MSDNKLGASNCTACFARQVEARKEAIANGKEPEPLCNVAEKMQQALEDSLNAARGATTLDQNGRATPDITGNVTG